MNETRTYVDNHTRKAPKKKMIRLCLSEFQQVGRYYKWDVHSVGRWITTIETNQEHVYIVASQGTYRLKRQLMRRSPPQHIDQSSLITLCYIKKRKHNPKNPIRIIDERDFGHTATKTKTPQTPNLYSNTRKQFTRVFVNHSLGQRIPASFCPDEIVFTCACENDRFCFT